MGWYVDGQHLMITHRVGAQEKLWKIDYDVADLVEAVGDDSLPKIAAAIRTTVRRPLGRRHLPRPRDSVHPTGTGNLTVRASFADHHRIGRLLEDLSMAYRPTSGPASKG